ncbi:Palmitoyl-acyl carrier protein thioesterase, chloroplastic [Morella rubra]|uniref:Acyl-[acyl-carrier-protein] hydrolase n=1 Tax=Morella rubra TaxID=262757 RepID=A0A6A1UJ11_9ROSI|nr:Palmitoyl-acyl carrier protein thioesterase, chloroplastic [Morella rubra]
MRFVLAHSAPPRQGLDLIPHSSLSLTSQIPASWAVKPNSGSRAREKLADRRRKRRTPNEIANPETSPAPDSRAKPAPKLLKFGGMKSKSAEASGGFQESLVNHARIVGVVSEDFAVESAKPGMSKEKLMWVVKRTQVDVDRYPSWGDVVQIEGWFHLSGRNGLRRDVFFRDCETGETLAKAYRKTSTGTRALLLGFISIAEEDSRKLQEPGQNEADFVRAGFTTRWNDLDANQHVNNVKYVGWILESAPAKIMESHEVSTMTLEYKRECGKDFVLQSLTTVSGNSVGNLGNLAIIDCQHLLGLEDGEEILRGKTAWRPKYADHSVAVGQTQIPSEST